MKSMLKPHSERLRKQAIQDAKNFLEGKPSGYRKVEIPLSASKFEVTAARRVLHATQKRFAMILGTSVETVRSWESGRRKPEGLASKVIRLLRKDKRWAKELENA